MKVMVLVKADAQTEAGIMPSPSLLEQMDRYNQALIHAGILLAAEGLRPSAQGTRVRFDGQQRTLLPGPFTDTHDLVAGFWLWQVRSLEEAIEWLKRAPFDGGAEDTRMQIIPYLSFDGQCREAFAFYAHILKGHIIAEMTYGQTPMAEQMPAHALDRVIHMQLQADSANLMGADGPPGQSRTTDSQTCLNILVQSTEEAERIFHALAEGGNVQMPMEETFWAHRFGILTDRYGKPWMRTANTRSEPVRDPAGHSLSRYTCGTPNAACVHTAAQPSRKRTDTPPMNTHDLRRTLDALWRMESPGLIARLTRLLGDVGLAEDLAQDVLLSAWQHWPQTGLPDNPAAWLMTAAKHRAIDRLRQQQLHARKHEQLAYQVEQQIMTGPDDDDRLQDDLGDDLLRLIFIACHPVLPTEARLALTLRLLGGLSTDEIARAFLQPEPTIAQRIVRAKRTLAQKQVPFEVPRKHELTERLDSVLEVLYLIFNEGYSATAGDDWMRPALCDEALRLGRSLAGLLPNQPEVHGLLALMELQASRTRARTDADGNPIVLLQQDRSRWDHLQIQRGLLALEQAIRLGGANSPYTLQAALAACHARATQAEQTDWIHMAALYARLAQVMPSPIVQLNRAVALSRAQGAAAALPLLDALSQEPRLRQYPALPAVRGDLLEKLGRHSEARQAFEHAAALTRNTRERQQMLARAAACRENQGMAGCDAGPANTCDI
ncbi:hypothetical protein FQR65_LT21009 [Abscondita terminalis]|nr:hypothetical protein FQR65_LT21009 [Abscondita terminalis]